MSTSMSCKLFILLIFVARFSAAQAPEPDGGGIDKGNVPLSWPASGPKCMEIPDWQVHEYNPNLYIIRQSGCLDYEKPFLYLLFGRDRGLLLDTGSRNFPTAEMLQNVSGKWLKRNQRSSIEILVVHTHAHSDHVAGDQGLKNLKSASISIRLIPATVEADKDLFGIANWPEQIGSVDLGDRVLDAIPIPGHSTTSIALYDRRTALLFTGDSLYPGRLYVSDWGAFVASTRRLVEFTKGKLVAGVLGNHIEQTRTAYLDYPVGTIFQPNEHALALSRGDLLELMDSLSSLPKPKRLALRDFSIWPSTTDPETRERETQRFKAHEKEQRDQMWDQPLEQKLQP